MSDTNKISTAPTSESIDTPEFRQLMWDNWQGYGMNEGKLECIAYIDARALTARPAAAPVAGDYNALRGQWAAVDKEIGGKACHVLAFDDGVNVAAAPAPVAGATDPRGHTRVSAGCFMAGEMMVDPNAPVVGATDLQAAAGGIKLALHYCEKACAERGLTTVRKSIISAVEVLRAALVSASAMPSAASMAETKAIGLLKSLWGDTGLRSLMRPDQARRIEALLAAAPAPQGEARPTAKKAGDVPDYPEPVKTAYDYLCARGEYPMGTALLDSLVVLINAAQTVAAQGEALTGWISVDERLPETGDYSVLAYWSGNGGFDMIHVERYFENITDGLDADGAQKYTKWYLNAGVTHWMPLPSPPEARITGQ